MSEWERIEPGLVGDVFVTARGGFYWGATSIEATSVVASQIEVGGLVCTGSLVSTIFSLPDGRRFKFTKVRRRWYRHIEGSD